MTVIALTTDFGAGSSYVAQMKGVLLSIAPKATLVDVTHEIAPQSLRETQLLLRSTAFAFPLGTTQLVVVDPGVGTERRGIAVESRGHFFVGPDNGILSHPLSQPGARAVSLDKPHVFRSPVAPTFHGRDIFAPVAAELARGVELEELGTPIGDPVIASLPTHRAEDGVLRGQVLGADRFGNLATNIPAPAGTWTAEIGGAVLHHVTTYGEVAEGELVTLAGSDGYVEVAVRNGSAKNQLRDDELEVIVRVQP